MKEEEMSEALDAISGVANELLNERKITVEITKGLRRIITIARDKRIMKDPTPENIVYDQHYQHGDGLTYRIIVEKGQANFHGRWHCLACKEYGAPSPPCSSPVEAVTVAITSIGSHKRSGHGG